MVSLGNNGNRHGAYFFDNDTAVREDDDAAIIQNTLSAEEEPHFHRVPTLWTSVVQIVLLILYECTAFVLHFEVDPLVNSTCTDSHTCTTGDCDFPSFSFSALVYYQAALWLVVFIIERYLYHQHGISRRVGYLEFYRDTKNLRRLPLFIISGGTALMLVVVMLMEDYHLRLTLTSKIWKPVYYLWILILLEVVPTIPLLLKYAVLTNRFNSKQAPPDVEQDDMMAGYLQSHIHTTEVGFRDGDHIDDILEKQADMIRYLQQHNAHLGRRILTLISTQHSTSS